MSKLSKMIKVVEGNDYESDLSFVLFMLKENAYEIEKEEWLKKVSSEVSGSFDSHSLDRILSIYKEELGTKENITDEEILDLIKSFA